MDMIVSYTMILIAGCTLLGLSIGSFLAARVIRTAQTLPQNLLGRSECMGCNHRIHAKDLIPVLGYLRLKGKCRNCHAQISPIYMRIELLTALLFGLSMALGLMLGHFIMPVDHTTTLGFLVMSIPYFATLSLLIYISSVDVLIMAFPVRLLSIFTILHLILSLFGIGPDIVERLGAALLFVSALGIIRILGSWIRKVQVMGDGDLWLAALIGASLGITKSIVAFYAAFIIGALVAVGCMCILGRKKASSMPLPFAPFLCAGWLVAFFFGAPLFSLLFPIW